MTEQELLAEAKRLNEEKKYEEVIKLLSDEHLQRYDSTDLRNEKAEAYYWIGSKNDDSENYENAIINYSKSLELNPDDIDTLNAIGVTHHKTKKYDKSIEYYNKIINNNHDAPAYVYSNLGNSYYLKKEYENAINSYQIAMDKDPAFPNSYNGLGNVYYSQKKFDKAIEAYLKAIDIDNKFSWAYNGLGAAYKNKKNFEKAIDYYLRAITLDSNYAGPYYNLGLLYYQQQDYANSLKSFQNFIEKESDKEIFYYNDALEKVKELRELIRNNSEEINKIVEDIKSKLFFEEACVTHYTGLSITQTILLNIENVFRISEGAYLNDTSEGRELFKFLDFHNKPIIQDETIALPFVKKPFIGSFVTEGKHDDLGLWRMYGKEDGVEAKGCAITINRQKLIDAIIATTPLSPLGIIPEDLKFYRVAYRKPDNNFIVPDVDKSIQDGLNELMINLEKEIIKFRDDCKKKEDKGLDTADAVQQVTIMLNNIAYLFKTAEYQYEQELRLIVENYWKDKKIDQSFKIPKVYIELVNISPFVTKLTLGPKVERAEEWAAAFHYQMEQDRKHLSDDEKLPLEIYISHLPYK